MPAQASPQHDPVMCTPPVVGWVVPVIIEQGAFPRAVMPIDPHRLAGISL